jgi:hypothetical protein
VLLFWCFYSHATDVNISGYSRSANEIWEANPVWHKDTCIKLTAQKKLEAVKCTTKLPVVCASDLEELSIKGDMSKKTVFLSSYFIILFKCLISFSSRCQ